MNVFRTPADLPPDFGPTVASIGNFDGVHRGHQAILAKVRERAEVLGHRSLAITFDPHPVRVLRPDAPHALITPGPMRLDLLAATGIDSTLVLPFTEELAALTPEQFATRILAETCQVRELYEGETFRFGYRGSGDMQALAQLGRKLGFTAEPFPPLVLRGAPVSSSRVRALLAEGQLPEARALLGRSFALRSTPSSGRGFGTRYTVPTINLAPYPELLPANGVYVTTLRVGQGPAAETFQAVTNIGNRPTFGADSFTVESHLLDFHPLELTPETELELTFLKRLRAEQRFPSPQALRAQIGLDISRAQRLFALCRGR